MTTDEAFTPAADDELPDPPDAAVDEELTTAGLLLPNVTAADRQMLRDAWRLGNGGGPFPFRYRLSLGADRGAPHLELGDLCDIEEGQSWGGGEGGMVSAVAFDLLGKALALLGVPQDERRLYMALVLKELGRDQDDDG